MYVEYLEKLSTKTRHLYDSIWFKLGVSVTLFLFILLMTWLPTEAKIIKDAPGIEKPSISHTEPLRQKKYKKIGKLSQIQPKPVTKPVQASQAVFTSTQPTAPAGWYEYGWCTYGAWSLAPWVGRWGDAKTWDDMAHRS